LSTSKRLLEFQINLESIDPKKKKKKRKEKKGKQLDAKSMCKNTLN
jgi:hypothetical protein